LLIDNKSFENSTKVKYFGTTLKKIEVAFTKKLKAD